MTLHLDSLYISGFRGIPKLEIPRLGRVTLLAGKNGVGKTAVLEAVRVYAARGRHSALSSVLRGHGELRRIISEDGVDMQVVNWGGLFYGRNLLTGPGIKIGPSNNGGQLSIKADLADDLHDSALPHLGFADEKLVVLRMQLEERHWVIFIDHLRFNLRGRLTQSRAYELPSEISCQSLGPGPASDLALARFWDDMVIRGEQSLAVEALNLILDVPVEGVAVVGDALQRGSDRGRRVIVQIAGETTPVPLQSLGDGAARLFGVAVALANSRDGFLLIDEAENGIHHSVQQDFWKLVLLAAQRYNVQVLATTHGGDCVIGFAKAVANLENDDGVYARLEKDDDLLRSVTYPNNSLLAAAQYGIETR